MLNIIVTHKLHSVEGRRKIICVSSPKSQTLKPLNDLFEIDTKNLSQSAMLQFLRLAFMSRKFIAYKLGLSFARFKWVFIKG